MINTTSILSNGKEFFLMTFSGNKSLSYLKYSTFLAATLGYGIYYVCRLSLNVVKKYMVTEGIFSETELGIIGSVLFFTYAIGKFTNGFLADRNNVKKFMSLGLLVSAIVNLLLGFTNSFYLFAFLWGVSGWFQSMGAASSVVALSRWFDDKERGTFYGFWSSSHNIGEALTFIMVATLVSTLGWKYGFFGAGIIGLLGVLIIYNFMFNSPQEYGFNVIKSEVRSEKKEIPTSYNTAQKQVLLMPAIWLLALASAFMYISRYAVNSWGIFYLETQKGYSVLDASFIISISSVAGIIGTVLSGVMSDKLFKGNRYIPAVLFGILNTAALCIFLLVPGVHYWLDVVAMIMFGTAIGVLLCFLGGLMAVDIAPREASGAALGIVGIASYIGAGLQDIVSGMLIEGKKEIINNVLNYDFQYINWFWIGSALVSTILVILVWCIQNYKKRSL